MDDAQLAGQMTAFLPSFLSFWSGPVSCQESWWYSLPKNLNINRYLLPQSTLPLLIWKPPFWIVTCNSSILFHFKPFHSGIRRCPQMHKSFQCNCGMLTLKVVGAKQSSRYLYEYSNLRLQWHISDRFKLLQNLNWWELSFQILAGGS